MDPLDEGTGGIHTGKPPLRDQGAYPSGHAVRTDHHRSFPDIRQLRFVLDHLHAFFFQILYHLFIVDDRKGYNGSVVNTICNATEVRQTEAREIAARVDVMIVIGGKHSSNCIHSG